MKNLDTSEAPEWGTEFPEKFYCLDFSDRRDGGAEFERTRSSGYGFEDEIMQNRDRSELTGVKRLLEMVRQGDFYTGVTFRKGPFVGQVHARREEYMARPHPTPRVLFYEKKEEEADYSGVMAAALWRGHDFQVDRDFTPNSPYVGIPYVYDRLPGFQGIFEKGLLSSLEKMSEEYRNNEHLRELVKFSLDQLQNGKSGVIRIPDELLARFRAQSLERFGKKTDQPLMLFFALMEIIQGEDDFCIFANLTGSHDKGLEDLNEHRAKDLSSGGRYARFLGEGIAIIDIPGNKAPLGNHTELTNLVDDLIMKEGIEGLRKRLHEGKAVTGRQKRFAKLFPGNPAFKEDPPKVVPPPKPVEAQRSSVGGNIRSGLKKFFG